MAYSPKWIQNLVYEVQSTTNMRELRKHPLSPQAITEYPKFESLRIHPEFSKHVWLVKLKNDPVEHAIAFGNLREWLKKYAR